MITYHQGPSGSGSSNSSTSSLAKDARIALRSDLGLEGWSPVLALKSNESAKLQGLAEQIKAHTAVIRTALSQSEQLFGSPETSAAEKHGWFTLELLSFFDHAAAFDLNPLAINIYEMYTKVADRPDFQKMINSELPACFTESLNSIRSLLELFPQGQNPISNISLRAETLLACFKTFEKAANLAEDFSAAQDKMRNTQKSYLDAGLPRYVSQSQVPTEFDTPTPQQLMISSTEAAELVGQSIHKFALLSTVLCACVVTKNKLALRNLLSKLERVENGLKEQLACMPADALRLLSWRVKGGEYAATYSMGQAERDLILLAACLKLSSDCPREARKALNIEITTLTGEWAKRDRSLIKRTLSQLTKSGLLSKFEAKQVLGAVSAIAPLSKKVAANEHGANQQSDTESARPEVLARFRTRLGSEAIVERTNALVHALTSNGLKRFAASISACQVCVLIPTDRKEFEEYLGILTQTLRDYSGLLSEQKDSALRPEQNPLAYSALRIGNTRLALQREREEHLAKLQNFTSEYLQHSYGYSQPIANKIAEKIDLRDIDKFEHKLALGLKFREIELSHVQVLSACPEAFLLPNSELGLYMDKIAALCAFSKSCMNYCAQVEPAAIMLGFDTSALKQMLNAATKQHENLAPSNLDETKAHIESERAKFDSELSRRYLIEIVGVDESLAAKAAGSLEFSELKNRVGRLEDSLKIAIGADKSADAIKNLTFSLVRSEVDLASLFLSPVKFDNYLHSLTELIALAKKEAPHFLVIYSPQESLSHYTSGQIGQSWREFNACRLAEVASPIKADREYDPRITIPLLRKFLLQLEEHDRTSVRQSSLIEAMKQDLPSLSIEAIRSEITYLVKRDVLDLYNNKLSLKRAPAAFEHILQVLSSERKWGRLGREQEESMQVTYMDVKYRSYGTEEHRGRAEQLRDAIFQAQSWVSQDKYDARAITLLAAIDAQVSERGFAPDLEYFEQQIMTRYPQPSNISSALLRSDIKLLLVKLKNYEHLVLVNSAGSNGYRLGTTGWENSINHLTKIIQRAQGEGLLLQALGWEA